MPTFTATFLSRDKDGRFTRAFKRLNALDHDEVLSYIRHGERNDKWAVEGHVTVDGPIGSRNRTATEYAA